MKKVYYQNILKQKSPMRIGTGDSEMTDSDLKLDGRGFPIIPGTSYAGVLRDMFKNHISNDENEINTIFGYVEDKLLQDSHVIVSDGVVSASSKDEDFLITIRDGIEVDEWGITVSGHKYDFQVVETKQPYYSVLEWTGSEEAYKKEIINGLDPLMKYVSKNGVSLGARTTRGYGAMSVEVKKIEFDFPADIEDWLAFSPFSEDAFKNVAAMESNGIGEKLTSVKTRTITAELKMEGSFSVRVNTARTEVFEDDSVPDSLPLSNIDKNPVIPGTSWAGVFRHKMLDLCKVSGLNELHPTITEQVNLLFGKSKEEGKHIRSKMFFDETVIEGGKAFSITRNAVDRFTQAPKTSALFTNRLWQGGTGTLNISFEQESLGFIYLQLLAAALIDLDLGLLTFGGESSVSRGRCSIETIVVDGMDMTDRIKNQDVSFLFPAQRQDAVEG